MGLQLKGPASGGSPTPTPPAAHAPQVFSRPSGPNGSRVNGLSSPASAWSNKRKPSSPFGPAGLDTKRPRTDDEPPSQGGGALKRRKSVTFTDDTKPEDSPTPRSIANDAKHRQAKEKKKAKKQKKKTQTPPPKETDPNLQPSLDYLRQWKTDRDAWKFNKNHQTLLIKYLFSCSPHGCAFFIPSEDTDSVYDYIRDLKGYVRTRLREQAEELRKADVEQGRPTSSVSADAAATEVAADKGVEKRQIEYEEMVSSMLQQRVSAPGGNAVNGNGKRTRRISEVDYALRTADPDLQRRLIKRIRTENVLNELSDGETSCTSTETATTGTSSQETADAGADKRVRLNDGSQQKLRRKRKRKSRDAMAGDDDASSSESDSNEASSTASSSTGSSSSSSEGSDAEMPLSSGPVQYDLDTSSSSSSSSSEGEYETGSDVDSGDEVGEEDQSEEEL